MNGGKPLTYIRRRGMAHLPNQTVHDPSLSYAALGMLLVILARPETAPQGYRDLQGRGLGQEATLRALRELTTAGYRHQVRRVGPKGRVITDTVVSEDPITPEQAAEWVSTGLWKNTPTVRRNPTHRLTRENTPSSQVAPRGASPGHGGPWHGQAPHVLRTQGDIRTTSYVTGETNAKCDHGIKVGYPCRDCPQDQLCPHDLPAAHPCALCRRPTQAPAWDQPDARTRATGEDQ